MRPGKPSELVTPLLLMAMPQVQDPFFHHSVVLLVRHEEKGSFGYIVNRPTRIKVDEILKEMEVGWGGRQEEVAYFGGPVELELGTVLFASASPDQGSSPTVTEVIAGVSLTWHVGDLARLAAAPPAGFRFMLGHAGWGAGQLMDEILRNDWLTAPARQDLIFAPDADRIWALALESVGVDPASLPSWTAATGGGEKEAN